MWSENTLAWGIITPKSFTFSALKDWSSPFEKVSVYSNETTCTPVDKIDVLTIYSTCTMTQTVYGLQ